MHSSLRPAPAPPQWRITQVGGVERSVGSGSWEPVLTGESAKLRVVSVEGGEVWVGGDNLRLYYSSDGGSTWTPVKLPAKGAANAIVHIRFQTALAGAIEGNDGTTWATTDGGKTWK